MGELNGPHDGETMGAYAYRKMHERGWADSREIILRAPNAVIWMMFEKMTKDTLKDLI